MKNSISTHKKLVSLLALTATVTTSALQGVIFSDDIETVTLGTGADGRANVIPNWGSYNTSTDQSISIVNHAGNQALRYFDDLQVNAATPNAQIAGLAKNWSTLPEYAEYAGGDIKVVFDAKFTESGQNPTIFLQEGGTTAIQLIMCKFDRNLRNVAGGASADLTLLAGLLDYGEWYRYELTIDAVSDTYDIKVTQLRNKISKVDQSGLPFLNSVTSVTNMTIRHTGLADKRGADFLIDNFAVYPAGQGYFKTGFEFLPLYDGSNDPTVYFNQIPGLTQSGTSDPGVTLTPAAYGTFGDHAPFNPLGGGGKALYFNDTLTTGGQLILQGDGTLVLDPTLTTIVSFDYYYDAAAAGGADPEQDMYFFMDDGVNPPTDALALRMQSTLRQVYNNYSGGTLLNGGAQLKKDTWYRYILTIHPVNTASDTYDLTVLEGIDGTGNNSIIDGSQVVFSAYGLPFGSDITNLSRFQFQGFTSGTSTHQAYFDNICISQADLVASGLPTTNQMWKVTTRRSTDLQNWTEIESRTYTDDELKNGGDTFFIQPLLEDLGDVPVSAY